jgi:GT2 family glycosyltransferase
MLRVSVIILTWNGRPYLTECLESLAAQRFRDFETILVDNGSSDGTAEYVRGAYPWVRLLVLQENVGFAEGNNRALALAQGTYIVTLNNDTKAAPEFLAELVRFAESDARIGMVAAKMRNYYQPERIDAVALKIGTNGLGYNIGIGETDSGQYDDAAIFGPCGGAALYRREMLDETGFFDSDFFAYYEDFDLAWRARLAGWKALAAPRALVYHVHSATGGEMSRFKTYYTHRNKWFVIIKNWPIVLLLKRLPILFLFDMAALVLACLKGVGAAAITARFDVVKNMGRLLVQRREVQARSKLSTGEIELFFSSYEGAFKTFFRKMHKNDEG